MAMVRVHRFVLYMHMRMHYCFYFQSLVFNLVKWVAIILHMQVVITTVQICLKINLPYY